MILAVTLEAPMARIFLLFQLEKSIHHFFQRDRGKVRVTSVYSKYRYSLSADVGGCLPDFTNCSGGKITVNIASFHDFMKARCLMIPLQPARIWWRAGSERFCFMALPTTFYCPIRRPEQCRTMIPDQLLPRWC